MIWVATVLRFSLVCCVRPVEAMCWADTLVHPIEAEDHGIGLIRFENGAMGQLKLVGPSVVEWTYEMRCQVLKVPFGLTIG